VVEPAQSCLPVNDGARAPDFLSDIICLSVNTVVGSFPDPPPKITVRLMKPRCIRAGAARLMTDVGLQMREAVNVLGCKHEKITSDQILEFAGKVAADNNDAANSRDLREEAMFSAEDVNNSALADAQRDFLKQRKESGPGDPRMHPCFWAVYNSGGGGHSTMGPP